MANWSASTEREVREYEELAANLLDRIERLRRERDRPRLGLVDSADHSAVRSDSYMDWKVVVCAICARDHAAAVGPELMLEGSKEIVCWACGFELAPEVAAEVLSERADFTEREALNFLSIAAKWLTAHVAQVGKGERAEYFEKRCEQLRDELRRLKEDGLLASGTWLS
jgi:hypothetical protein